MAVMHLAQVMGADAYTEVGFGAYDAKTETYSLGTWKVAPLRMKHRGTADRLLAALARPPLDEVAPYLERLPDRERAEVWAKAEAATATWVRPAYGSYEASHLLKNDPDARWQMFRLILRANNPEIPDETLAAIWEGLTHADFLRLWSAAVDASDPKAMLAALRERTAEEQAAIEAEMRRIAEATKAGEEPVLDPAIYALSLSTMSGEERRWHEEELRMQDAIAPYLAPMRWIGVTSPGSSSRNGA